MTATLTVLATIGVLGVFIESAVFRPGAAAVRPASLGMTPTPGCRLAAGDDEQPAR